jgi:hypothetical protein
LQAGALRAAAIFVCISPFALSIAAASHFCLECGMLLPLKHDRDISGD